MIAILDLTFGDPWRPISFFTSSSCNLTNLYHYKASYDLVSTPMSASVFSLVQACGKLLNHNLFDKVLVLDLLTTRLAQVKNAHRHGLL